MATTKRTQRNVKIKEKLFDFTENTSSPSEVDFKLKCLPINYCINMMQDGYRNMDRASHLNEDELENKSLETKLRPISGIRNHIKRNLTSAQSSTGTFDILKDTDVIQRIGSVKTLKRLDLSYNNLQTYPRLLCDLPLLEQLNLEGNSLQELPSDIDKYQYLNEITLDFNQFKKIPKFLARCKKLTRLSIANNQLAETKYLEYFKRVKYLILNCNEISQFDDNFKLLDKLEVLDLSHNKIESISSNTLKSSLINLKHLDLSYCKLQSIPCEIFMLNHLEMLNLSNNHLIKLPAMPMNYYRTVQIFSIDLSSNQLIRFYEYLLTIAQNIDLSSNKIKTIPTKIIEKYSFEDLETKNLVLDLNPLIDPPAEICNYGLRMIKEYFDDVSKQIQLNKGFKIVLLGDKYCGKTSLAYALEDHNCQTNLIEQYFFDQDNNSSNDISKKNFETKLIDIHEFFLYNESLNNFASDSTIFTNSFSDINEAMSFKPVQTSSVTNFVVNKKTAPLPNSKKKLIKTDELNAFSNSNLSMSENDSAIGAALPEKYRLQMTIYDLNGSIDRFSHLINLFLDKNALIIICIDCTNYIKNDLNKMQSTENSLKNLLDIIILKMSKTNYFYILPVLTKCDKISSSNISNPAGLIQQITNRIQTFIKNYLNNRIDDIKMKLQSIELQKNISASQSEKLKQLVQTQSNLNPEIYKYCVAISSFKMDGIKKLNKIIKDIVFNNQKYFADVNKKVPTFWIEVEKYACNKLSQGIDTYIIRGEDCSKHTKMSILCIDYEEYKEKVIEKYGMKHLIDSITKYMSSSGRIIWYHDSERLKRKVFLRPYILFDLFFVLYRTNFDENFNDIHTQSLRIRLTKNANCLNQDYLTKLKTEYLKKGNLHLDLLKLLWFPILMTDSMQLVQEIIILFMNYFHIGYPSFTSKDKLRTLFHMYSSNNKSESSKYNSDTSSYNWKSHSINVPSIINSQINFNTIIIPFYLPYLHDSGIILSDRFKLVNQCMAAVSNAVSLRIKKFKPASLPKISLKYAFPWGLISGIFERFSSYCMINSELFYKSHYRDYIYAINEESSIGVLIHTNSSSSENKLANEVTFEFFLISYELILENLQNTDKLNDDKFEQTLTMDLDQLWTLALKILSLFEESINSSYPSLIYDRWSMCPECESFTILGEFFTPKELQKAKSKICPNCQKLIEEIGYLVKPLAGRSLTMDLQKMHQRLEKMSRSFSKNSSINTSVSKIEFK